jgi:ferredoxin-NADP reductase
MSESVVKILKIESLTQDVKRFEVKKPAGYTFIPGQATEVAINKLTWKHERRPFTFTSLNESRNLEFVIKRYPAHKGVTDALHQLSAGDELVIHDVWGAINFKGNGIFIAGGAGITPFIAILRQLHKDNKIRGNQLIFSNKTKNDIILNAEFEHMLGPNYINVITQEKVEGIRNKRIDKVFLLETVRDFSKHFYVCGPDKFVNDISDMLVQLGAGVESVIIEK